MNNSPLLIWLDNNIQPNRMSRNIDRDGQTVTLKEVKGDFSMKVRIENVERRLVIFNFEQGGKTTTYFKGDRGFGERCDFLILDETDDEYLAYLIELENTVPSSHGASQLRWSVPYLKYVLEVFLEDKLIPDGEKKLRIKFFQIGHEYQTWIKRSLMKRESNQRFVKWDGYDNFDIFYCAYKGHKIEFCDFGQE